MIKNRAFLKWAGGKYSLIEEINKSLPQEGRLVEPFVGAGSVFLNSDFDEYLLNDVNADLINLYKLLQSNPNEYITESQKLFDSKYNDPERYYEIRKQFNSTQDAFERSVLFLYMNRHGYNGLCRYNLKGGYNVPFGRYKKPYFPEKELWYFAQKSQKATFTNHCFRKTFESTKSGDVIYCDPPYAPLSPTASFTSYSGQGFKLKDQEELAILAQQASTADIPVLISNHDLELTRRLYEGAHLTEIQVKRTISQKAGKRLKVSELLARY